MLCPWNFRSRDRLPGHLKENRDPPNQPIVIIAAGLISVTALKAFLRMLKDLIDEIPITQNAFISLDPVAFTPGRLYSPPPVNSGLLPSLTAFSTYSLYNRRALDTLSFQEVLFLDAFEPFLSF